MKNLKDTLINESKFGYTWENAFICAIKLIDDENKAKGIIEKWFDDEESARPLRMFLFRLGHDPKSTSPEDLYDAIKEITIDNKFNITK